MASSKTSWPAVARRGDTGRFTWEQIDKAVERVVARREAREAKAARAARKSADAASALGGSTGKAGSRVRKAAGAGRAA